MVNALSSRLEVESWRNNDCWHCVYERGEAKLQPRIISRGKGNGTKVTFWPDPDIFDSIEVDTLKLRETIQHAAYLFPGIKYKFLGEEFFSEKGLSDLIEVLEPGIDVRFSVNDTFGKLKLNVALGGQAKENATQWHSWSNGVQMREHGSHLEGVKKALDGLGFNPAIGLIHVVFHDPKYAGPTKGELLAPEIVDLIANELAPLLKTVKTIGQ